MSKSVLEDQVKDLVESIVQAAMADEYKEAMQPFDGLIAPQMENTLRIVFESGLRVGASQALIRILDQSKR